MCVCVYLFCMHVCLAGLFKHICAYLHGNMCSMDRLPCPGPTGACWQQAFRRPLGRTPAATLAFRQGLSTMCCASGGVCSVHASSASMCVLVVLLSVGVSTMSCASGGIRCLVSRLPESLFDVYLSSSEVTVSMLTCVRERACWRICIDFLGSIRICVSACAYGQCRAGSVGSRADIASRVLGCLSRLWGSCLTRLSSGCIWGAGQGPPCR